MLPRYPSFEDFSMTSILAQDSPDPGGSRPCALSILLIWSASLMPCGSAMTHHCPKKGNNPMPGRTSFLQLTITVQARQGPHQDGMLAAWYPLVRLRL